MRFQKTNSRVDAIDAAKGLGIVLVVVGHTLGGIIDSDLDEYGIVLRYAFLFIYTFHMPLFLSFREFL